MEIVKRLVVLLLALLYCEVTTGIPIQEMCTSKPPSMAQQDYDVISKLLGCDDESLGNNYGDSGRSDVNFTCDTIGKDTHSCRVTQMCSDFSSAHIKGRLPHDIGKLTYLRELDLSDNHFHGQIPKSIANLSQLTSLDIGTNLLEGVIPQPLGEMKSLKLLVLYGNFLSGSIPTNLGSLGNLTTLVVSDNLFNGSIPTNLGSLGRLEILGLGNNLLTQGIPIELGKIKSLEELYLYNNQLSGPLPDQLRDLTNLVALDLRGNQLVGELPPRVMELKNLQYFNVRGNNLSGQIPHSIGQLQNLDYLSLMGNNFEAPLPSEISTLTNLTDLHVSDLVGEHTANTQFPDFSKMSSLRYLTLRNCSLADRIPPEIWNLESLYYLDLSFNSLFGGIPPNVSNPPTIIFLRNNKLNETIPTWMMHSTSSYIDVSENLFTNNVTEISNLNSGSSNLNFFSCLNSSGEGMHWEQVGYSCKDKGNLSENLYINCGGESVVINGSKYEADLNLNGSSTFFLSRSSSWGYSSMGSFVLSSARDKYIVNNTCAINVGDELLYGTARVSPNSLKYYGFCLRTARYTVKLHFAELVSKNYKNRYIKGGRLFNVDIQGNNVLKNFSIEKEAGSPNTAITKEFNISVDNNSRLEIHLYWSGKGATEVPTNQYGPLVSAISVYPIRDKEVPTRVLVGPSVSALLILILLMAYFWTLEDKSEGLVELYPGGLYNFRKIKSATKNFKDKLGEGGFGAVYKASLKNGATVAVEKISATKDGIIRVFQERNPTIYPMEHPNLVKLMGCLAEKNHLLLVYEYMGRNTLQNVLFGPNMKKLDWPTRCKICLDTAEGLFFLHNCKPEIVHGNIKPANIFLDDNLDAKISNFGFARLHDHGKSRVDGTVVYMAPEYAILSQLTTKADVYSFGVLLLVVLSGRPAMTPMSSGGGDTSYLTDEAPVMWRNGNLMDLVDSEVRDEKFEREEAETILELAMLCLEKSPMMRPTMSQVVKVLKESSKQPSNSDPQAQIEDTKSRSTSKGGMTDISSISASPSNSSTA